MTAVTSVTLEAAHARRESHVWRNAGWSLCGTALPMIAAAFVLPRLIERLGANRFGLLTIAWTLVGYLSLFDFGVGRSLTKLVAERLGLGDSAEVETLWSGSMALLMIQGIGGAAVLVLLAPWLTGSALKIPAGLQHEARISLYCVALIVPLVTISAGLRGFLEAHCAFLSLNIVKMGLGVCGFVGPLLATQWSVSVTASILTLLVARAAACAGYFVVCLRIANSRLRFAVPSRTQLSALLRLGGWMTVSNLVSPLMASFDSFVIGALISVWQIQYYSVPAEAVNKGLLVPSSLAVVLFPVFSSLYAIDRRRAERLYTLSIGYLIIYLAPFALACIVFARSGLTLWLGPEFAERSYRVAQIIAVGVFMNGIASVPFALLQASGRPDITARLHLLELPLYAAAVFVLTSHFGVAGAAVAWTGRVAFDAILLLMCSPVRLRFGPLT